MCTPEHGGTHLDAQIRFAEGKSAMDAIPPSRLIASAVGSGGPLRIVAFLPKSLPAVPAKDAFLDGFRTAIATVGTGNFRPEKGVESGV
ncbi:MAG: cyclase family protein [Thermoanaerobaculia bacterium]